MSRSGAESKSSRLRSRLMSLQDSALPTARPALLIDKPAWSMRPDTLSITCYAPIVRAGIGVRPRRREPDLITDRRRW